MAAREVQDHSPTYQAPLAQYLPVQAAQEASILVVVHKLLPHPLAVQPSAAVVAAMLLFKIIEMLAGMEVLVEILTFTAMQLSRHLYQTEELL